MTEEIKPTTLEVEAMLLNPAWAAYQQTLKEIWTRALNNLTDRERLDPTGAIYDKAYFNGIDDAQRAIPTNLVIAAKMDDYNRDLEKTNA